MEPEYRPGSLPPDEPGARAKTATARFSVARVLFTLSITCPIMVFLLSGYDYRVRMVPLSHAILLMAPLVGFPACLALPRDSGDLRSRWHALPEGILLLAFHLIFIWSYVGIATIRG
jgi:hypothetical protein